MKKLIYISILILIALNCHAQTGWVIQPTPISNISDIQFINSQIGFISGGSSGGQIAKTTNGGVNWTLINVPHTELKMTTVEFLNSNTGWCSGYKTYPYPCCPRFLVYYKTTNGGQTWDSLPQGWGYKTDSDIHLFSKDSIVIASVMAYDLSNGGIVSYSNNSGSTFTNSSFPGSQSYPGYLFYSMHFLNNLTGWVCANANDDTGLHKTFVYKTTDRGVNWNYIYRDTIAISPYPKKVRDVVFINENTGLLCGSKGLMCRTTNGGSNWSEYNVFSLSTDFSSIFMINSGTGFVTASGYSYPADSSAIKRTTDGGISWHTMRNSPLSSINKIFFVDDLTGWAYGAGGLMKTVTGGLTSITTLSTEVPEKFTLKQNFPNPFNPATNINYELPVGSFVSLNVYDANGKEIETLVNQKQNAGSYSVSFNASNYPSGVYFYKLKAGEFSETRKMVLVK